VSEDQVEKDAVAAGTPPSASQCRLLGEDVLVRAAPANQVLGSGLVLTNLPKDFAGGVFYGTVVATGPGRLVERAPDPETLGRIAASAVETALEEVVRHDGELVGMQEPRRRAIARIVEERVRGAAATRTPVRVPIGVQPGDAVACRTMFGPEVRLREGSHQVVGRGGAEHGHGVVLAWTPGHVHCWHKEGATCYGHGHVGEAPIMPCSDSQGNHVGIMCGLWAACACGERKILETRLPACTECPPGERLAEALLAHPLMKLHEARDAGPAPDLQDYEDAPEGDGTVAFDRTDPRFGK
jgi:hypothetical protein